MKKLLESQGWYGKRVLAILAIYGNGTISNSEAIQELRWLNSSDWVRAEDIATVQFWALWNSL